MTYIPQTPNIGTWDISTANDSCSQNEAQNQASYAAENLNINGAPLNVYKLLGIHEQGSGSLLSSGILMSSSPAPGYPLSNVNNGGSWRSSQIGSAITGTSFVGIDFGAKLAAPSSLPANSPAKPNWQQVGAVVIQQGDTATNFARQVRVDITDGDTVAQHVSYTGTGINPTITLDEKAPNATSAFFTVQAIDSTSFSVSMKQLNGTIIALGTAIVGVPFKSIYINFTISASDVHSAGDVFTLATDYVWKRAGVFNLVQSASPITLNLKNEYAAKAVRVVPTLYTGTDNWEILAFDVLDSAPTDINNVQDLFFQENRDRDYSTAPLLIKAQYSINDSISDLSKFGLNILDQYSFTVSFPVMVQLLGRPLVTGDIIEVIPEMQYDHNLVPIKKFLEVTDTGWASAGYSTAWKPTLYRFQAQEAIPSQETRDIFGTLDSQKYLTADSILADGLVGSQVDVSPLTVTEETLKQAAKDVPEEGSDDELSIMGTHVPNALPPVNQKGQPEAVLPKYHANSYIEDGLPKNGESYGEGYVLPDVSTSTDGAYFRLYYPESTSIAPRLYRFSAVKNRWIFMEQDRRGVYTSAKPSVHKILNSPTKQGLK